MSFKKSQKSQVPDQLVVIRTFQNEIDAEIALEQLRYYNIEASIQREDPAGMGLYRGAKLIVHDKNVDKAIEIIENINS